MIKANYREKESSLSSRSVYICAVSSNHYVIGANVTCFLYNINSYDTGIQMHRKIQVKGTDYGYHMGVNMEVSHGKEILSHFEHIQTFDLNQQCLEVT